jgi:hypothetical protein
LGPVFKVTDMDIGRQGTAVNWIPASKPKSGRRGFAFN